MPRVQYCTVGQQVYNPCHKISEKNPIGYFIVLDEAFSAVSGLRDPRDKMSSSKISPRLTRQPTSSVSPTPTSAGPAVRPSQPPATEVLARANAGPANSGSALKAATTTGVGSAVAPTAAPTAALTSPVPTSGATGSPPVGDPTRAAAKMKVDAIISENTGAKAAGAAKPAPPSSSSAVWKPRMCIIGVNKKWADARLAKYLTDQGVSFKTVKKLHRKSVAFISFSTPEEKEAGVRKISTLTGQDADASGKSKGRPWLVADVKTQSGNTSKGAKGRRKRAELEGVGPDGMNKRQRLQREAQIVKTARDAVTPHWRVPYERQLAAKNDEMVNSLKRFRRRIRKEIVKAMRKQSNRTKSNQDSNKNGDNHKAATGGYIGRDGVDWSKEPVWLRPAGGFAGVMMSRSNTNGSEAASKLESASSSSSADSKPTLKFTHGLPCPMEPIVGMTETLPDGRGSGGRFAYRNKCEFTFGRNRDGDVVLGFRVSSFGEGTLCESPHECGNVPEAAKQLCGSFEKFVRASSLPIYDVISHEGVWRQLTVQCSARTRHLRGIVQVKTLGVVDEVWSAEKTRMTQWCEENKVELGLTGMLI